MRNNINILSNGQSFMYLMEYRNDVGAYTDGDDIAWTYNGFNDDIIYLLEGGIEYYRNKNDWYDTAALSLNHNNIPNAAKIAKLRLYVPLHAVTTYVRNVKYAITANTWINGKKIDLGSFIFNPSDTIANESGAIKMGNNEYHEYVEFNIIDPFDIVYSDNWIDFRHNVCDEPLGINSTGSLLNVTMYIVEEYDNRYIIKDDCIGGITAFNISDESDLMALHLSSSLNPLGLKFAISLNKEYDFLLTYLSETYGLNVSHRDISFELIIKNKNSAIVDIADDLGTKPLYNAAYDSFNKELVQYITLSDIKSTSLIKQFFNSWESFNEGWNFVGSLIIHDNDENEILTVVSNELPITQELFSIFVNGGAEKIMNITDDMINVYNVVNKIENKVVHIERPNDSKSNIIQPVFFKVKDAEILTLHPAVTENICINLDDYKSKVDTFILQIDNCKFTQIGANNYGILFKITGNKLPAELQSGTYYILNEDSELVTTGKFNCVR